MIRSRSILFLRRSAPSFVLALSLAAGLAGAAAADDGAERAAKLRERAERTRASIVHETAQREDWQAKYRKLLVELRSARENQQTAQIERRRDRRDYRLRGELRVAADQKLEDANNQRQAAYDELIEFFDAARANAIEPGWLRQVEDEFPELFDALPDRG